MTIDERNKRILATGTSSEHCHVVTGNVTIDSRGGIIVTEESKAVLRHLIKSDWLQGKETWTKEHEDIPLAPGRYEYQQQMVYDPLTKRIEAAKD